MPISFPIVVSLCHGDREIEYVECDTREEAAELLRRKTVNGFRYTILPAYLTEAGNDWDLAAEIKKAILA